MSDVIIQPPHVKGQNEEFLVFVAEWLLKVHRDVVAPLRALMAAATAAGFALTVTSAYRDFARQSLIWNEKARGARPIFDPNGKPLRREELSDWELVQAILHWSALPGASRHHWGTDVDVYDKNAVPESYQLQLSLEETEAGGVFAAFYQWLDRQLLTENFGFFRPYCVSEPMAAIANQKPQAQKFKHCAAKGGKGVACEPWHLSHAATARQFQSCLTLDVLEEIVSNSDIALKETVLAHLDEIYQRFVLVDAH